MAIANGAVGVKEPYELKDENGVVVLATVKTVHNTLILFQTRKRRTNVIFQMERDLMTNMNFIFFSSVRRYIAYVC
jgi:hypothetical protein